MSASPVHLFGIRHHGPGCARSLAQALDALDPDCLLIEGPPEAEGVLPSVLDPALVPPVALLVYDPEAPREAVFYPFAAFSPEWIALRHGLARGIPTRFMDLPVAHSLALDRAKAEAEVGGEGEGDAEHTPPADPPDAAPEPAPAEDMALALAPLDWLGQAAGHPDGESWWNQLVEERGDGLALFEAIREIMETLRGELPTPPGPRAEREALREAHMRKCLRQAVKDGYQRIAVVCGAWHLPALSRLPAAKADNDLLRGLPKRKLAATWVPWSYANLSRASGYGAGVAAPAWYEHLWETGQTPGADRALGWLVRAGRLLRDRDLDCSSAHLIEARRLAETLAALRGRPRPGLEELDEALLGVVCMGDPAPLSLIRRQLVLGDRLGSIPADTPALPIQQDLARCQKSLRLKPEAGWRTLELDLRQPTDLGRSQLLHRLRLLEVSWGRLQQDQGRRRGSFGETWQLCWAPELALAVIEASRWGTSIEDAATACAVAQARDAWQLARLAEVMEQVLLADLPAAVGPVARALEDRAALEADVGQLLDTIPPLVQVARYGNVRGTDGAQVLHLLDALVPRAAIGLPGACQALDNAAAEQLQQSLAKADQALGVLGQTALLEIWQTSLLQLARSPQVHGLVSGLAARLALDHHWLEADELALLMGRALSPGTPPGPAAAWLDGFLNGSGMVLLHDDSLWNLVERWLCSLPEALFIQELPLLRRSFTRFSGPERRQMGERAKRPGHAASASAGPGWDGARAARVLPLLACLLGVESTPLGDALHVLDPLNPSRETAHD